MQSSRKPRRSFAAPLILSVAALPVSSACLVTSNKPATNTTDPDKRDHRQTDPDPTQPDDDTRVMSNPPRPTQFVERKDSTYEESWSLRIKDDGTCMAYARASCPENATCNPPPPRAVACPEYIKAGESWDLWSDKGSTECFVMPGSIDCPVGASCNPPPPQKASCPE